MNNFQYFLCHLLNTVDDGLQAASMEKEILQKLVIELRVAGYKLINMANTNLNISRYIYYTAQLYKPNTAGYPC